MSSNGYEQEQIRQVAERIARRLANGTESVGGGHSSHGENDNDIKGSSELADIRAGLSHINQRLTQIERNINPDSVTTNRTSQISQTPHVFSAAALPNVADAKSNPQRNFTSSRHAMLNSMYVPATSSSAAHPSQERFGVGEAISELVDYFENEKACGLEPDKPCDQCAMCSSRGF